MEKVKNSFSTDSAPDEHDYARIVKLLMDKESA
jgi:hypothetical protein